MRLQSHLFVFAVAILALAIAGTASAQTGSIQGRVVYEGQPMPGVRVTATSPALQGEKSTVTNVQGDYKIPFLPGGDYKMRFELASFATLEYDVRISTSQPRTLDAIMYPEAMSEEIVVTGQYETVSTGAQGSETMQLSTLEKLPVGRTLQAAVGLAAGTSATGPGGNTTISGAQSYENLYTLNGVVMNENVRGQPFNMYIEDAVLETTTMTSNMSAEYGRFAGGVVNMVTKSGGNQFSGSFRSNFSNESWEGETPLTTDQADETNTTFEATFGGYIMRDKLWFFLAGRSRDLSETDQLVTPGQPEAGVSYPTSDTEDRYEGKLTWALNPSHRLMASYMKIDRTQTNNPFFTPADTLHIVPSRELPLDAYSFTYNGVLSDSFFLEGLYSKREFTFVGGGGDDSRLGATPIWEPRNGVAFNAPIFCNSSARPECTDEMRNNENIYAKGSWFVNGGGTHDIVVGLDRFDDIRQADNWQSASGYIYYSLVNSDYSEPGNPLVRIAPGGGFIIWGEVLQPSQGDKFTTNSAFVNDTWRLSNRWTVNLGLRYDQNKGTDQSGTAVVDDSRISPRLSASWDVMGDGKLILNAGANRYVTSIANTIGDSGSLGGQPTWAGFLYVGPEIIAGTPEYPTNFDAMTAMFDWFLNVYGGPTNTDWAFWYDMPGLSPKISTGLSSPYGDEFTLGASYRLGTRGVLRADLVRREYGSFYASEIVPNRSVQIPNTESYIDQALYVNYDAGLTRKYSALQTRFDYRIGSRWSFGATYTYSKAEGNFNGETGGSGPVPSGILEYQEYKESSWNTPNGWLSIDQRHKFRGWVVWDVIASTHHNLSVSLLQSFWSGSPYSATGDVDTVPVVGDPDSFGYAGNPGYQTYFFSKRGEFRWDDVTSTDLAINYSFFINIGGGQLEIFLQPEVLNVFNESAVIDGNTSVDDATNSGMATFDPFSETPVEGTNWAKGDEFGNPEGPNDYQRPRTFRFSVGIRF
ncbi:MAG: carboxypeptidase regulatory-like domain-containing protein [Thermoanaerobaculales bacterium]